MGCDIHLWLEKYSSRAKRWMMLKDEVRECEDCKGTGRTSHDSKYKCWLCHGRGRLSHCWYHSRNYDLFAILADVRNGRGFGGIPTGSGFDPISTPRGIPPDASIEYLKEVKRWDGDGHSHSYHTLRQLLDYDWDGQRTTHTGKVSLATYKFWRELCTKRGYEFPPYAENFWEHSAFKGPTIPMEEADRLIASGEYQFTKTTEGRGLRKTITCRCTPDIDKDVALTWRETYRYAVGDYFFDRTVAGMKKAAERVGDENVRLVFFFDN